MVATILSLSFLLGTASAQGLSASAVTGAVTSSPIGLRPGFRVGYEPSPLASLEAVGLAGIQPGAASDLGVGWEAGLGLSGRAWLTGAPGDGLFLLGRITAGVGADPAARIGPWVAPGGGFGGRISDRLNIEATVGPEWTTVSGGRWRTELNLGYVFGLVRSGDTVRHRPRRLPR